LTFKAFTVEAIRQVVQEENQSLRAEIHEGNQSLRAENHEGNQSLLAEIHEGLRPIRTALSFSIYSSLDPWAHIESVSSSTASRQGRLSLMSISDYYDIPKQHYCMFLGAATNCHIISTHLWPSHTRGAGLDVMSLAATDINTPRNYLRLHSQLEKAFDNKRIIFEHSPLATDTTKFKLRLKIFDPDFRTEQIIFNNATILADTLDNVESDYTFDENRKPFRRIIALHCQKAITSAMEKGWVVDEANIVATRQRALELARLSLEPQVVGLLFPAGV
jgi:hypothetical protein